MLAHMLSQLCCSSARPLRSPSRLRAILFPNWIRVNNHLRTITTAKNKCLSENILRCCSAMLWHLDRNSMFLKELVCRKLILHQTLLSFKKVGRS